MEAEVIRRHRLVSLVISIPALLFVPAAAVAQTPPDIPAQTQPAKPVVPSVGSKWWIVGGGGFSMARASCATCSREGVFTNGVGFFLDVGGRINPRVDAGVEGTFVSGRIEDQDSIHTTFILGVGQFRPWVDHGLYLRAGMGIAFAGNGLAGPIGQLAPPYSTNALGVTWGLGWIFKAERRYTVQASFSQHIAALGELSTVTGTTIKNVVANYWTSGLAIVIR
jgi:hypothetical protein